MRTHFVSLLNLSLILKTAGMNLTRRAILGVNYPNILDLSSPQYTQLPHAENSDPRYVKISDWKPGKVYSVMTSQCLIGYYKPF